MTTRAEPFSPYPVEKFNTIVESCAVHRPWFSDFLWEDPQKRREAVVAYLADGYNNGKLWEVWRDQAVVGILLVNQLVPFQDARCHFIFFDSALADKRQLCLNLMGWAFENLPVEVLRVELPTYAKALLKFTRKLGFRYECEGRSYSWPQDADPLPTDVARLGSRKHHAILYDGTWHDLLLLSVTAGEFREHAGASHGRSQHQSRPE